MSAYSTGHNILMYGFWTIAVLLVLALFVLLVLHVGSWLVATIKSSAQAPRVPVIRDDRRAATVPHRPVRPRFTHHRLQP